MLRFYLGYGIGLICALVFGSAVMLRIYAMLGRYKSDEQLKAGHRSNYLWLVFAILLVPILAFTNQCGASLSCFSFETILRHEVGHVLGLDHPDIDKVPNLDTDAKRGNAIPIDAKDPCKDLKLFHSPNHKIWKSIMVSHGNRNTRQHKLAHDDLGGLYFLYPHENKPENRDVLPFEKMGKEKLDELSVWAKVTEKKEKMRMQEWLDLLRQREEEEHVEDEEEEHDYNSEL